MALALVLVFVSLCFVSSIHCRFADKYAAASARAHSFIGLQISEDAPPKVREKWNDLGYLIGRQVAADYREFDNSWSSFVTKPSKSGKKMATPAHKDIYCALAFQMLDKAFIDSIEGCNAMEDQFCSPEEQKVRKQEISEMHRQLEAQLGAEIEKISNLSTPNLVSRVVTNILKACASTISTIEHEELSYYNDLHMFRNDLFVRRMTNSFTRECKSAMEWTRKQLPNFNWPKICVVLKKVEASYLQESSEQFCKGFYELIVEKQVQQVQLTVQTLRK